MKVLCIGNPNDKFGPLDPEQLLEIGANYSVVKNVETTCGIYYQLEEKGCKYAYHSCLFLPLSDIDETQFERNYDHSRH